MTTTRNSLILLIILDRCVSIFRQYVSIFAKTRTKFGISVHTAVVELLLRKIPVAPK